ncbi:hypothetical protein RQP46_008924 [Phenoliferia psychrophenolica]
MPSPRRTTQSWQPDHQATAAPQGGNLKGLRRDSYVPQQEESGNEGQLIYLHAPTSPAGYVEYPDYAAPGHPAGAWPTEEHREPHHAGTADTLYDYFGIPIPPHQHQNHAAMAPTPPYSPLYSPNGNYQLNPQQIHPSQHQQHPHPHEHHHQQQYHSEPSQSGYISPNDVHIGHSPRGEISWGPVAQDEYYMERPRMDSFDAYTHQQTLLWEQGDAPISPRPSWGSESPRQHDEIQMGESASSPKSSQGEGSELRVTESATPFISKLSHLLNSPEYDTFIRWSSRGNCFIFAHNDPLLLASFAKYFRHSNCQSFVRQLNIYGFTRLNATELHATMATSQLESHVLPADEFSAFIHPRFYRDEPGRPCPVGQLKPRVAKKKASKGGDLSSHLTSSPVVMAKINIKTAMHQQSLAPMAKRSARKSEIMRRPSHDDHKPSVFEVPTDPGSWYQST